MLFPGGPYCGDGELIIPDDAGIDRKIKDFYFT